MQINLNTEKELDQEQTASVFEDIAKILREDDDLESKQLMDGSYRFETRHGKVFLTAFSHED
jgi:hypothetical protein